MKKILVGILSLLSVFLYSCTSIFAADSGWVIESFHSDIIINQNTSVRVTETIKVNFNTLEKHGIYRVIPVKYATKLGHSLNIRFKLISITDENGAKLGQKVSREGKNVNIRIGNPDFTVTGQQTYIISYEVSQVITQPSEAAELYWNVTGNNWAVPINQASANVTAPAESIFDTICFVGYLGDNQMNCTHSHNQSRAEFSASYLQSGEGLTIATALDPSKLKFPGFWQKLLMFLEDNKVYAVPLITLGLMTYLYLSRGRDKQYKNIFHETQDVETVPLFQKLSSMSVYSPPKDLSPGEVGVLVDEKVDMQDITAIAIDLARQGFFSIKEIPKKGLFSKTDYQLSLKGKKESKLHDFEKEVLNMLFGTKRQKRIKLNQPPKTAYKHLDKAKDLLYKHLTEEKYFSGNPKSVRLTYLIVGLVLGITGCFILSAFGLAGILASIISGLIIIIFSFFMPSRTAKGRKALKQVVGLKEWIRIGAWREQIHEKHLFLEEVLPFAIAFGLTYKFLKAFKSADLKDLSWYQSTDTINIANFSHAMDGLSNSINSAVSSTRPKSSASSGGSGFSGGFSGGGFGGGGGGSW